MVGENAVGNVTEREGGREGVGGGGCSASRAGEVGVGGTCGGETKKEERVEEG